MNTRVISIIGILVLILGFLAGAFYIQRTNADLAAVRQQAAAANEQLQSLKATLTQAEKARDEAQAAQAAMEVKLAEVVSTPQQSPDELAAVKLQLSETQAALQHARKISGYWRDLFDYTKAKQTMLRAQSSGNARSEQ